MGKYINDDGTINHDADIPDGAAWYDNYEPLHGEDKAQTLVSRTLVIDMQVVETWTRG